MKAVTVVDVCGVGVDGVDESSAVGYHARERSAHDLRSEKAQISGDGALTD
jgi:hypothetical protein